jgi:hypothetical protein
MDLPAKGGTPSLVKSLLDLLYRARERPGSTRVLCPGSKRAGATNLDRGAPAVRPCGITTIGEPMDVRRLLSAMALEVHGAETPTDVIDRIAHYARVAVDADDSGIMIVKARGKVETPAGTSDNITKAHALQAELDEGPCLDAIRSDTAAYITGDARTDKRWTTWGPRVAMLGYRSVVSVRLETNDRKYGSLNAYSAGIDAFSRQDVDVLEILAAHASVAIAASQSLHDLHLALDSRTTIGQAQGILMAVYDLDAEGGFQYLRRLSQDSNRRLVDICKEVVAQRHEVRKHIS